MALLDTLLGLAIPGLILVHLLVAPYTKVEESFNLQATHDVLAYGIPLPLPAFLSSPPSSSSPAGGPGGSGVGATADAAARLTAHFDHFTFPGAVPRSFLGAVVLAGVSRPILSVVGFRRAQLVVRALLGLFNAGALLAYRARLHRAYGSGVARWWTVLLASGFHVVFYASRTLPNMFAFGLTTFAFSFLLPAPPSPSIPRPAQLTARDRTSGGVHARLAVALFVLAAVVFRAEVALLLAANAAFLVLFYPGSLRLRPLAAMFAVVRAQLLPAFVVSFAYAIAVSVPLDTYLWQAGMNDNLPGAFGFGRRSDGERVWWWPPLWPELAGFVFNAVRGGASAWGVQSWHFYFSSALPRIMGNPVAAAGLVPLSLSLPGTRAEAAGLVLPQLLFLAAFSLQPHKEARFVFYVVPPLAAAAALGAEYVFARRSKPAPSAGGAKKKKPNKPSPPAKIPFLPGFALSVYGLSSAALLLSVALTFAASTAMLLLSSLNYPGGEALGLVKALAARDQALAAADSRVHGDTSAPAVVAVHVDVLACMTGVTLFGQHAGDADFEVGHHAAAVTSRRRLGRKHKKPSSSSALEEAPVKFAWDKTESPLQLLADPAFWARFDYAVVEDPRRVLAAASAPGEWELVAVVAGLAGVELLRPGAFSVSVTQDEAKVLAGRGRAVARLRDAVRSLSGGWWVGPRMEPRLRVLRRRAIRMAWTEEQEAAAAAQG